MRLRLFFSKPDFWRLILRLFFNMTPDSGLSWEFSPIWVVTWIRQSSLPKKSKLKFDQDSIACWSFCFELKVSNESKFSMPLACCAFGNVWRPILRPYFFETAVEILWHKILSKYYMWIVHISLEMVTARTFKSNRFHFLSWNTWTTKFFWDQNFWDQYQDFFETKSFENNTETFLRPKFSRPILSLFF